MKNTILILSMATLASACVKLEVNPESVISDTIQASKDIYQSAKHNINGEQTRVFTHTMPYDASQDTASNTSACKTALIESIKSSHKLIKVHAESSEITDKHQKKSVICSIDAIIKS